MTPSVPPVDAETPRYVQMFLFGLLASMGGATKFITVALRSKEPMTMRRFLTLLGANILVSGFSGLIGALWFSTLTPDLTLQFVAAGVLGYAGPQFLDLLVLTMQRKVSDTPVPLSAVIPVPPAVADLSVQK
jgi:hypothetical protein